MFQRGVFQGNPIGPLTYLIQEDAFQHSVIPNLQPTCFVLGSQTITVVAERYSDDSFFMALDPQFLNNNIQVLNHEGPA